jgi:hypothetical protein
MPVGQPREIPQERLDVLGDLVAHRDRLRVLQMREPRGRICVVTFGLVEQRVAQRHQLCAQTVRHVEQEQSQIRRDLVVAAAPGPQASPDVLPRDLDQTALQSAVHILVGRCREKGALGDLRGQRVQPGDQRRIRRVVEQTRTGQGGSMRLALGDVVRSQRPVEVRGAGQFHHGLGRWNLEPAAPQTPLAGAALSH